MILQVKSNGRQVEMRKDLYDALPEDSKRGYIVITKDDAAPRKEQLVKNEAKQDTPPTGQADPKK